MVFPQRIITLEPSSTLSLDVKVKDMQRQGKDVINLGLGEPDFTTPSHIKTAAIHAIQEGYTHYTQTSGFLELREAIKNKLLKENHIQYNSDEIIVGTGSKMLLYLAFQSLCDVGDEVIVPAPTWSTYVEQIKLSRAIPVVIPLAPPFKLSAHDVEKAMTSHTKVIVLNSPANPTGAMITRQELINISKIVLKRGIMVISDEIYESIRFRASHVSIASLNRRIRNNTLTINGLSKSHAMTGWRIGYAAGPKPLIDAMISLQTQTTSNSCSIAQKAALAAIIGSNKPVENMRKEYEKRRAFVVKQLTPIKGVTFCPPDGAFYVFLNIKSLLGNVYSTSQDWCNSLLEEMNVSVVPGEAFLYSGYVRLSFATSMKNLRTAISRIKVFIYNHHE